ncbi:WD repeat-containing protein 81, partial [Dispira simplex]
SKHVTKLFISVLIKSPSAISVIAAVYRELDSLFGKIFTVAQFSRLVASLEGLLNRSKTTTSSTVVLALVVLCQELTYCLPSPMVLEEFNSGLGVALLKVLEYCQDTPHPGIDRWFITRRMVLFLVQLSEGGLNVDDYWESSIEPVVYVYFDLFITWGSQDTLTGTNTSDVVEHLVGDFSRICRVWGYDRVQRSFSQLCTLEQVIQKIHQPHTTLSSLLDAKTRLLTLEIDETLDDAEDKPGKSGGDGPMSTLNNLTQLLVHKPLKRSFSLNEKLFMSKLGQALPPFGGGSRKPTVPQIAPNRNPADFEQGNVAVSPIDATHNEEEEDAGEENPNKTSRSHTPASLHVTASSQSPQPRLASSSAALNFSFSTRVGVPSLPQGLFKKALAPQVIRDDFKNWRRYLMAKSDEVPLHSRFGFHELGLRQYLGHTSKVLCLATNESRRHFLSGSKDRTVKLWSLDTPYQTLRDMSTEITVHQGNVLEEEGGAPLSTFTHAHGVRSVHWVHAQEWVGTSDGMVHLWSPTTGTLLHTYKTPAQLMADCVPHDHGRLLYATTPDGDIYGLSVLNQEVVGHWRTNLFGPNVFCRSLTVDPHQPYLYAAFSNGSLLTLDQRMGRHVNCTQVTEAGSDITAIRHTLDHQILVKSYHNRRVLLYDTKVHGLIRSFSSTLGDIVDAHVLNEELIYLTNQNYIIFQPLYEQLAEGYSTKFSASVVKAPLTQMGLCPENEVILLGASNGNIHMYA